MGKTESIEELYKRKFDKMPENIHKEIGHFNAFRLQPELGINKKPVPYIKRDYFKITLVAGNSRIQYADKVVEVQKQALVFSNPHIPYKWEETGSLHKGCFCIFDQRFFHLFGDLNQYSVFQPKGTHAFELTDGQMDKASEMFERIFEEMESDYAYKNDVFRTIVFELIHFAMKMQPITKLEKRANNAAQRVSSLFLELLERQFPIDGSHQSIQLRSPSDFAKQLNVHVNHLNRAVKETTAKTTSQIIAERLLRESKILLTRTAWNVSEIAFSLGFSEVTHFNNFFKKHVQTSPLKFRND